MKKILAICFSLLLVVSMVGCNSKDHEVTAEVSSSEETQNISASNAESIAKSNAVNMCQFVKDCLGEPDSFQIHGVSHIEENGHHFYYLDFSHQIKEEEMERTYYFAEFDSSKLLYIINENSAIYYQTDGDYTAKYPIAAAMLQEEISGQLDVESIVSKLS